MLFSSRAVDCCSVGPVDFVVSFVRTQKRNIHLSDQNEQKALLPFVKDKGFCVILSSSCRVNNVHTFHAKCINADTGQ